MHNEISQKTEKATHSVSSEDSLQDASTEYVQLQRRIFQSTLIVSALVVVLTAFFVGIYFSMSVLFGALSGMLYLRLLARSIGRLGVQSGSVSKAQLLVPVVLVLAVTRLPHLELLPSLLGFLLYKPSLVIQYLLKP